MLRQFYLAAALPFVIGLIGCYVLGRLYAERFPGNYRSTAAPAAYGPAARGPGCPAATE